MYIQMSWEMFMQAWLHTWYSVVQEVKRKLWVKGAWKISAVSQFKPLLRICVEIQRKTTKNVQYEYPAFEPRIDSRTLNELNRLHSYSTTTFGLKKEHEC